MENFENFNVKDLSNEQLLKLKELTIDMIHEDKKEAFKILKPFLDQLIDEIINDRKI